MEHLRCAACREVIGVYEPMLAILPDGSEHAGSRLTLSSELAHPNSVALHECCHRERCHRPGSNGNVQDDGPSI